jgi:putative flippase GtrA
MKLALLFDRTLLKFMIVGVINTLVGLAITFTLLHLTGRTFWGGVSVAETTGLASVEGTWGYWVSTAASYVLASVLSFFLNKHFTFKAKHRSAKMVLSFILTIIIAYLIAYSIAAKVMYTVLKDYSPEFRDRVSTVFGMCLFTGLNYLGQRFVAFRRPSEKGEKEEEREK